MGDDVVDNARDGTGQIAKALATAQGKFLPVGKDKTAKIDSAKGRYSYSYADLASILAAVRPALGENGLAIVQIIAWSEGHSWLVTRLLHSSGQSIESTYPLREYDRPQEMGSALTYARRYSLTALLGIAAEEDDDGAAAQAGVAREEAPRAAPPLRPAPAAKPASAPPSAVAHGPGPPCPECGTGGKPQKFPVPGRDYYCPECAHAF